MSRIGKKPINIPDGITVSKQDGNVVCVAKGSLSLSEKIPSCVDVSISDKEIVVNVENAEDKKQKAFWGMARSLVDNMVKGLTNGFSKQLAINGIGYRVSLVGNKLVFNLGFSHEINFLLPEGITAKVENNIITISGYDKQLVGHIAANIRKLRKPEPYKGKGIKYIDEEIRRKAGKAAKATAK